jgi:hypothetical protein
LDTSQVDSQIVRVFLLNNATRGFGYPPTHIDSVYFRGIDKSDFYNLADERGYLPIKNFNLNPGDSMWIDIVFHPDLTKPYRVRHADLVASDRSEIDKVIHFTATVEANSDVKNASQLQSFSIRPNPASGNSVIISFPEQITNGSITIFDVLGREVYTKQIMQDVPEIEIPIRNLGKGSYYARLVSGSFSVMQKFEVIK